MCIVQGAQIVLCSVFSVQGSVCIIQGVRCHSFSQHGFDLLYKLTVRSVLEYSMIVYFHSLTQIQIARLDRVQNRAARICSGTLPFTSQVKLEQDMCWETLADRDDFLSLIVFHKFVLGLTRPLIKKCIRKKHKH